MLRITFNLCLLSFIAFTASAQTTTQPFDRIFIEGNIHVILRPGDAYDVDRIDLRQDVEFIVSDGFLVISHDHASRQGAPAVVTVNYQDLKWIRLFGGASLEHEGMLQSESLVLAVTNRSEIDLSLECDTLTTYASNYSKIKLHGTADRLNTTVKGKSDFNSAALETLSTSMTVLDSSTAVLHATSQVDGVVSDNSTYKILGKPLQVDIGYEQMR